MMADPDVESLANEMAAGAAGLVAVQAIDHLKAILEPGCDPAGESRCNWCGGEEFSPYRKDDFHHMPDCPWVKARGFLDNL